MDALFKTFGETEAGNNYGRYVEIDETTGKKHGFSMEFCVAADRKSFTVSHAAMFENGEPVRVYADPTTAAILYWRLKNKGTAP